MSAPRPTRRLIVAAAITVQAVVLALAWTLHRANLATPAPPRLVAQVLAPDDMVYADSDVAAARGQRLPPIDVAAAMRGTPQQVADGRTAFEQRCTPCHGPQGRGDGPVGITLNPRPRNLTSLAGWKGGTRPSDVFTTVTLGLAGTQMAGFDYVPAAQRFALVQYVVSLAPGHAADTRETLDALDRRFQLSEGAAEPNTEPLADAIRRLVAESPAAPVPDAKTLGDLAQREPAGAALFAALVPSGSRARVAAVLASERSWPGNGERLRAMVVPGAPANGFDARVALLSNAEWAALARYLAGWAGLRHGTDD